jgi:hypothetical protein
MSIRPVTAAVLAACALLQACAIHQNVRPVERLADRQVCVIENPAVRAGFLDAYRRALMDRGYTVRQLPATATQNDCPVTSTYSANWRWDLAMYMAYAEINVFRGGQKIGEAKYDALRGGGNMGKFIEADKKILDLVRQLFPAGS